MPSQFEYPNLASRFQFAAEQGNSRRVKLQHTLHLLKTWKTEKIQLKILDLPLCGEGQFRVNDSHEKNEVGFIWGPVYCMIRSNLVIGCQFALQKRAASFLFLSQSSTSKSDPLRLVSFCIWYSPYLCQRSRTPCCIAPIPQRI